MLLAEIGATLRRVLIFKMGLDTTLQLEPFQCSIRV
jgi:hypothetical protein